MSKPPDTLPEFYCHKHGTCPGAVELTIGRGPKKAAGETSLFYCAKCVEQMFDVYCQRVEPEGKSG